jgi:hypothetical protein
MKRSNTRKIISLSAIIILLLAHVCAYGTLSVYKTFSGGEILTHSDLNSSYSHLLNYIKENKDRIMGDDTEGTGVTPHTHDGTYGAKITTGSISDIGTIATQDSNAVNITGGTITNLTSITVTSNNNRIGNLRFLGSASCTTLAEAIAITGNYTLLVNSDYTMTADANIPARIGLKFQSRAKFTLGSYNLYVRGSMDCPPGDQAFNISGAGRVYFRGSIDRVYPEWFGAMGDGITNDTNAFTYAHQAGQGIIQLSSKTYDISTLRVRQPMRGISHQKSIIDVTGAGLYLSPTDTEKYIEISDLKIKGTAATDNAVLIDCNQSRGYLRNLWLYTDGNNDLTGIRLKQSHHSALDHILIYGGNHEGFEKGIYVQGIPGANVNNVSYSEIHIADSNCAIKIEEDSFNNNWDTVYIEACTTGIYFKGVNGVSINDVHWDAVTTWIYAPQSNYSIITSSTKTVKEILTNSSGYLYDLDIQGRGVHHVKKLAAESTKAFTLSCDPNSMEAIGNLPPELRLFGWNRSSDTHYGYTQGGLCLSLRPSYGKIKAYTYTGSVASQCWEVDPTSTTGYRKEKVVGANGEFFQTAIRSGTVDLLGATTNWSEAILAGRRILGVNVYVTDTITGSGVTGFTVGDGTDADRWGAITGTAIGTVTGPSDYTDEVVMIYDALTPVRITATGGSITDGTMRIVVYYQEFGAPTS